MPRPTRSALLLLLLASSAFSAARTRSSYAWDKLCTIYPPFKDDIKTESACPSAAIDALSEFVQKYPSAPEAAQALYLLGQCHYSRGEASAAVKAYWRCVDGFGDTNSAQEAAFGIVRVYGRAQMWDAGRKQIDKLAKKLPKPEYAATLKRRFNALEHLQIGKAPIPFSVKDVDGRPLSLEMFKGKVVLLMFWATWCPHCTPEVPHISRALSQVKSRDVEVVSISLDRSKEELRSFCRRMGVKWRHHCDGKRYKGELALKYDITKIPQIFLLDRQGIIRYMNTRGPLIATRLKRLVEDGK